MRFRPWWHRARGRAQLRYEKNPQRLRARRNYEKLLALARGEYVKFLNDDDVLEPDCVARLLRAFQLVPDLVLATSHRLRIDAGSRVMEDMPATRPAVARDVIVEGVSLANAVIMYGLNFIGEPSTALFRKRDFDRREFLDGDRPFHFNGEEVRGAADLAMWSRLLVQGNAVFLRDRLSRFRIHGEQAQARPDVVDRSIAGIRALQRQWVELGLFQCLPPHLLRVQPFPRGDGDGRRMVARAGALAPSIDGAAGGGRAGLAQHQAARFRLLLASPAATQAHAMRPLHSGEFASAGRSSRRSAAIAFRYRSFGSRSSFHPSAWKRSICGLSALSG